MEIGLFSVRVVWQVISVLIVVELGLIEEGLLVSGGVRGVGDVIGVASFWDEVRMWWGRMLILRSVESRLLLKEMSGV